MLSEDLNKNTFSCCHTHIQVWLRWEEVMLTGIQFINILKHRALSQTLVKQLYSAGFPVTWGSLETRADRVAKAALSLRISPCKVSVMDFLARAKLLMRKEWQEIWNCCDGNKLHAINSTVGVTKQKGSLSWRDAVIINQLQIGHTRNTHAHLLGDNDEAFCTTCYTYPLSTVIKDIHFYTRI